MKNHFLLAVITILITGGSLTLTADPGVYIVKQGDTLYALSRQFNVSMDAIRELNGLENSLLRQGQAIKIPGISLNPVKDPGRAASLSEITTGEEEAASSAPTLKDYRSENWEGTFYRVRPGDTLWSISRRFNIPLETLLNRNPEIDENLPVGVRILIRPAEKSPADTETPERSPQPAAPRAFSEKAIAEGAENPALPADTEPSGTPRLAALLSAGSHSTPRERRPPLSETSLEEKPLLWEKEITEEKGPAEEIIGETHSGTPRIPQQEEKISQTLEDLPFLGRGYYFSSPLRRSQPSRHYQEETTTPADQLYTQARRLWETWTAEVRALPPYSVLLEGVSIILDPGHGGTDPGAVVPVFTPDGGTRYVVEDEYAYDIALRTAALLIRHGAQVEMTVLSPNHLIRESDARLDAFVNEKNEILNHPQWGPEGLIRAGTDYLEMRSAAAARIWEEQRAAGPAPKLKLFISLHADSNPQAQIGPLIFYRQDETGAHENSRNFAAGMKTLLRNPKALRGEELCVLKNNPADAAVLVELRNLAWQSEAAGILTTRVRQQDAEDLTAALIEGIKGQEYP